MSLINEALRKTQQNRTPGQSTPGTPGTPAPGHRPSPATMGHNWVKALVALVLFGCAMGAAIAFTFVLMKPAEKAPEPEGEGYAVGITQEPSVTGQTPPTAEEPPAETVPVQTAATPQPAPKVKARPTDTPAPEPEPAPVAEAPLTEPAPAVAQTPEPEPAPVLTAPQPPAVPIAIMIARDGSVAVSAGGQEFTASDIATAADTVGRLFGDRPNSPVTIRADKQVPFPSVMTILDSLREKGFEEVSVETTILAKTTTDAEASDIDLFLENADITGVRVSGENSKVLMNNQVFRPGDVVSSRLGLKVVEITTNALVFEDESGQRFRKSF